MATGYALQYWGKVDEEFDELTLHIRLDVLIVICRLFSRHISTIITMDIPASHRSMALTTKTARC